MSFFEAANLLPDDPILSLPIAFEKDLRPNKVNLGIGAYKDAEGKPMVLQSVRNAEMQILEKNLNKEYLPIEGHPEFLKKSLELIFGQNCLQTKSQEIFAAQSIGGTGALRLGGEFLAQETSKIVFLSEPSWPNHKLIFTRSGLKVDSYPYYNSQNHSLDFEKMCDAIKAMPPASIILLQAGCHNPTGIDPSFDQWKKLSEIILKQKIIPFFDLAYQGFGLDIEEDAKPIRYFVEQGHELFVASSYSKNMGLYGERAGLLSIVSRNAEIAKKIGSNIKQIIRGIYSTPSLHPGRLVATILQSENLKKDWLEELTNMRTRITEMRKTFVAGLLAKGAGQDFRFMNQQLGLFSYCGLDQDLVEHLRQDYAIYMPKNGRINIAGLNLHNMSYVIESILSVLKNKK